MSLFDVEGTPWEGILTRQRPSMPLPHMSLFGLIIEADLSPIFWFSISNSFVVRARASASQP
jgi:hypothetical protein